MKHWREQLTAPSGDHSSSTQPMSFISTELSIQVSLTAFTRARRQIVAAGGTLVSEPVDVFIKDRHFVRGLFRVDNLKAAGELPDILDKLPKRAPWRALVTGSPNLRIVTETGVEPRFSILKHPFIGFGTDAILGFGFQYYEDSYNPYFRWDQQLVRASVSGAGGAGTALLFVSLGCGPEAPACALALSALGGLSWAYIAQPTIFESIPYLQPPPRNLQPFD